MNISRFPSLVCLTFLTLAAAAGLAADDVEIPPPKDEPRVVDPDPLPSDAIVLFDGEDLSQWKSDKDGAPAKLEVKDGVATVNGTGGISTKQSFGDCQLHIEWAAPEQVKGEGQGRGNSGIFLQGRYEVQILDSYHNKTYYDGQAGAVYKQHTQLVNACRKPGESQAYDIRYHAPRFDGAGKLLKPRTVTILQNGVLIQDHVEIMGPTARS